MCGVELLILRLSTKHKKDDILAVDLVGTVCL